MAVPRLYSSLAKYYDRLEGQYRNYEQESAWLASLIKANGSRRIIDVSCGTGRHVSGLLREFRNTSDAVEILAMDSSPQMVKIADKAFRDNTIADLLLGDFFNPPAKDGCFDFALCMYWSLAGLDAESVRVLFRRVHSILKEGGMFVFDVENADGIKEHLLDKPFVDGFFFDDSEGCTVIRVNLSFKTQSDLVDWRAFYVLDWGSLSKLITDRMNLRFYKKSALELFLEEAGFNVETITSSPFGKYEEKSPSLYFVASSK
jgi:SAM-dependent methyltransferase